MADQEHRAVVAGQQLFEEVEGFDVQRSLVGSSSTSTLAGRANRRASSRRLRSPPDSDDRRAGALGREQEIPR